MSEIHKFAALTSFFIRSSVKSKGFLAISVFTTSVAFILLYLTIDLGSAGNATLTPLAYLYGRISGVLQVTLTYFLWSVPFATLIVFSTAFLSAFTFGADMEGNMRFFVYSLPAKRSTLLYAKFSAAFAVSSAILVIYYGIEGAFLGIHFMAFPPMDFFVSLLLSLLLIGTIVSITFFIGMFMKNPTFVVIAFLSIYFIVMDTMGIASEILVGNLPSFLLSTAGAVVSEVFSGINLLPFGQAGTIAGADSASIIIDVIVLFLYLTASLVSVYILHNVREVK